MTTGGNRDSSDWFDTRGQSVVVGSILIFGILVAGLGAYQATIVPSQNKEVEFNHQENVQTDFSELYAGIMNAAERNSKHTSSIRTGVNYPPRALTLNPPDAAGTIRTEDLAGSISASGATPNVITDETSGQQFSMGDFCGPNSVSNTKSLVYEPNYNILTDVGVLGYESSVKYQDINDQVPDSSQDLVDGGDINLVPVGGDSISKTSTSSESITLKAGTTGGTTVDPTADWTLTLPTRLSPDQWRSILEDEERIKDISGGGGTVDITFKEEISGTEVTYDIRCTPIGIDEKPENNPVTVPSEDDTGGSGINPAGPGVLELESAQAFNDGGESGFEATFTNNAGEEKEVLEVRAVYVTGPGGGGGGGGTCGNSPCEVTFKPESSTGFVSPGTTVEVGGEFEPVNSPAEWVWTRDGLAGSKKKVRITDLPGSNSINNKGISFELKVRDSSGTHINTYFVSTAS